MHDSIDRSFGLLIAYLLPGFVCILSASPLSPTIAAWLSQPPTVEPTLGAFAYVTMSSLAAGLTVNAMRWLLIDSLLHHTGVIRPPLNYRLLQANLEAFELAVHHNYRYYQSYANGALSLIAFVACQAATGKAAWPIMIWLGLILTWIVLLLTARDSLRRYYERLGHILDGKQHAEPTPT